MDYKVVELEKILVVGESIRTTNENGQAIKDIGHMWENFFQKKGVYDSIMYKANKKVIGLYTDYEGDERKPYKFMCGTEVDKSYDSGLETCVIPKGRYAKFTVVGQKTEAVGKAWEKIWQMNLSRAFDVDFELYHNESLDMNDQKIDIFISLI